MEHVEALDEALVQLGDAGSGGEVSHAEALAESGETEAEQREHRTATLIWLSRVDEKQHEDGGEGGDGGGGGDGS